MKYWARRGLILCGLWLALGCAPRSGQVPQANNAPKAPPAAPALPLLRVGASDDYAPFSVREGDSFAGFSVALVEQYAASHGLRTQWIPFEWPELVAGIQGDVFALAASGITVRPERSIAGRYSVPVAQTGSVLLIRAAGSWTGPLPQERSAALAALDGAGLRIGVNRGGHLERVARRFFPHATLVTFPDNALVPQALARGELDAALTNDIEAERWAAVNPGVQTFGPFTREDVAFFLRADDAQLADSLDDWLLALEGDGSLAHFRETYLGARAQLRTALIMPAMFAAMAERLSLMPFVAAAKERAQRPIDDPGQEQRVLTSARTEIEGFAAEMRVESPLPAAIEAFMRAQLEAAKAVQRLPRAAELKSYDLERELRPAIARISHRMYRLSVRIPARSELDSLRDLAWSYLAESGLTRAESDGVADAVAGLGAR